MSCEFWIFDKCLYCWQLSWFVIHCAKIIQIRSSFWSVFFRNWTEYGDFRSKSPYSVRIRKIRTRINSVFGHFSLSDTHCFEIEDQCCLSYTFVWHKCVNKCIKFKWLEICVTGVSGCWFYLWEILWYLWYVFIMLKSFFEKEGELSIQSVYRHQWYSQKRKGKRRKIRSLRNLLF